MFHRTNMIKYAIMLLIVTSATKVIPTCGVLQTHAIYVGLIASSTFALLDMCLPHVIEDKGGVVPIKPL